MPGSQHQRGLLREQEGFCNSLVRRVLDVLGYKTYNIIVSVEAL